MCEQPECRPCHHQTRKPALPAASSQSLLVALRPAAASAAMTCRWPACAQPLCSSGAVLQISTRTVSTGNVCSKRTCLLQGHAFCGELEQVFRALAHGLRYRPRFLIRVDKTTEYQVLDP